MKKLISLLSVLFLGLVIVGCGDKTTTTTTTTQPTTTQSTTTQGTTTTTTSQTTTTTVNVNEVAKAEFLADHATVLALTAETVKIEDKEAIDAALTAYNALEEEVQALLVQEAQLLEALTNAIYALEDAIYLAEAIAEAVAALEAFDLSSYREAEKAQLQTILEEQKALVAAATSEDDLVAKKAAAAEAIAAVKTNVQLLVEELGDGNVATATATAVNVDAGGDAFSIWTTPGLKIREIDAENNTYSWVASTWRFYFIFDAEGKVAYAVVFSDSGYGGPTGTSYYAHPSYSDYSQNPAISIHETFEVWPAATFNMYELVIPEGGFALSAHGTGIDALLSVMLGGEQVFNDQALGNYNNRNLLAASLRGAYDVTNNVFAVYHDVTEIFKAEHAEVLALTVEEVSLAHVELLNAAKAGLELLSEAQLAQLETEVAHLTALGEALQVIVETKVLAVATLDGIVLKSYPEASRETVSQLVAEHKALVEAATTLAGVQEAATAAATALAEVKTNAELLVEELGAENVLVLNAAAVNSDAGGDAFAIWTNDGEKIREVTATDPVAYQWIASPWRQYLIFDAEGKMMYGTIFPDAGYGGPHSTSFAAHPDYHNTDTNSAYTLLPGYADWVSGQTAHNLYELSIPEGGFAVSAHGLGINELLTAFLGTETVFADNPGDFNKQGTFASQLRVEFDATNKTLVVYKVKEVVAKTLNADAAGDAFAIWTEAGTKLRSVSGTTGTWIGNGWRYYVVVDGQGRIAYAVCMPPNGYGGPAGQGYYAHPSYTDYTQNPAIVILDGYADNGQLFEIVIPEGGFALTAHGKGIEDLVSLFTFGEMAYVGNDSIPVMNSRSAYASELRLSYDANSKQVFAELVEETPEVQPEPVTYEVTMKDYAAANGWKDATKYTSIQLTETTTATCTSKTNSGKYYTNGNNWRLYQSEGTTLTITSTQTIVKVIIEYTPNNTGALVLDGKVIASGAAVEVNANTLTLNVGNSGTATNGQARITKITVVLA